MDNLPLLIVILILFILVAFLWGIVNYMKGREQMYIVLLRTVGIEANKAAQVLKKASEKQNKDQ